MMVPDNNFIVFVDWRTTSTTRARSSVILCCQTETDNEGIEIRYCTICDNEVTGPTNCGPRYQESSSPMPPPPGKGGPGNVLPEGVLEGPETAPSPEGPTELTPQVDCALNPNDPQGETATIPQGEIDNDNETQSRINTSPTGYCVPHRTPTCIPCEPGLPGNTCIPGGEWSGLRLGRRIQGHPQ
jgi:hypothetical protein